MIRRARKHLSNAELANKASRRAKVSRVLGIIFTSLAGVYLLGFLALGLFLADWKLIIFTSAVLLATSGFSLFSSANTDRDTAARYRRLAGVSS